ncbi:murein hydrolase activator EnvC family protein [Celerinatantimonas yamalensis]|uniref:Peptidoglycan DD-metalloendopeptidase family protein n=1 Tax=Celerinatantimonas yamalensis TaxID=559956 RepID=A0ABW9G8T5_9GAMM
MKHIVLKFSRFVRASLIAGTFGCALIATSVFADNISQQQLDSVTQSLRHTHQVTQKARQLLAKLQRQLKQDELALASQQREIQSTAGQLSSTKQQLSELQQQAQTLETQQHHQQQLLSDQVAAAYQMGQGSYLKMLLNQNKMAEMERLMAYYQYLNQSRLKAILQLKATTEQLQTNQSKQQQRLAQLKTLLNTQKDQQQKLLAKRQKRQQTLKQTNQLLANNQLKSEQLTQAKNYLNQQIKDTPQNVAISLNGLSRNSLSWPVKGSIIHDYHSPQIGGNSWDGVVIKADTGTPVKAVADGKVVFADWLRGYGLVIVLSHGHNYLTLYGFNQTLLHKVGDRIKKGQEIATVGSTGGQEQSSLFFQIRYKSQVENPHRFVR